MDEQEYHLLGDTSKTVKPKTSKGHKIKKLFKYIIIISIIGAAIVFPIYYYKNNKSYELVFIRGESRVDKYGVELNKFVLDGIYCTGFDSDANKTLEEWSLYTPPCPHLRPVHYPDNILNPDCEDTTIQFVNMENNQGVGVPHTLRLHDIKNQLKKWKKWEKKNETSPSYADMKVKELMTDEYHPFDYGYVGDDTSDISDEEYYSNVINSRMDEVPDPRRRRLFSFILFNSELDMLDMYLSEFYEIVDYFFIYEANTTFNGNPKPLLFTRTLLETDRYDKFKDKLIPYPIKIIIDEDNGRGKAFPREHNARRLVIAEGLKAVHARHGDLFMHSDLDEMAKPHVLSRIKKCGGWEHLQTGIGGGPKSFKDGNVQSYLYNPELNVTTTNIGFYEVDYQKSMSIGTAAWFYEYSFNRIQNTTITTNFHPNIAIFDARRALGQFPDRVNKNQKRGEYPDPLLDPKFDPYQGYLYTNNTNDLLVGKGFPGEYFRFSTSTNIEHLYNTGSSPFWSAGWHLSSFLPTINHIYNKAITYSHFYEYKVKTEEELKEDLKKRIRNGEYMYGDQPPYAESTPILPKSYKEGYTYDFSYKFWENMEKNNAEDEASKEYIEMINREVPSQVWKNPICYSYMLDRDFGLDKDIWWEAVPKDQWKTVRFEKLDIDVINKITPPIITDSFKAEMLDELSKEQYDN